MSILPIHTYGQPALRKKAKRVREANDDLQKLIDDMFETMHNAGGIGLAANQVGVLQKVIVVDVSDVDEVKTLADSDPAKEPLVFINPEVVHTEGKWTMEEGCLSIPGIREEIERAKVLQLQYRDERFIEREITADGILARVLLHEIDHVNGVLFIDHLTKMTQRMLRGRLNKITKGEVEIDYPFVSEQGTTKEH